MEDHINEITYDENWRSVSESEYPVRAADTEEEEPERAPKPNKPDVPMQYLLVLQLIVCGLIALAAFVIKGIGGDFYAEARQWYYSQLNNTLISDGRSGFDLSSAFTQSTPDEA